MRKRKRGTSLPESCAVTDVEQLKRGILEFDKAPPDLSNNANLLRAAAAYKKQVEKCKTVVSSEKKGDEERRFSFYQAKFLYGQANALFNIALIALDESRINDALEALDTAKALYEQAITLCQEYNISFTSIGRDLPTAAEITRTLINNIKKASAATTATTATATTATTTTATTATTTTATTASATAANNGAFSRYPLWYARVVPAGVPAETVASIAEAVLRMGATSAAAVLTPRAAAIRALKAVMVVAAIIPGPPLPDGNATGADGDAASTPMEVDTPSLRS